MSRADELRAELTMAEQEEAFIQAKEAGEATREQKDELRAARQAFRKFRDKVK